MQFNSTVYLLFLPVTMLIYWLLPRKARNLFLAIASYIFYGWWDYRFLGLLFISTVVDYGCGVALEKSDLPKRRKAILFLSLIVNLGILATFKYFNFFVDSAAVVLESFGLEPHLTTLNLLLPVGISFYTFQTMSYTIDVYRRQLTATRDFTLFMVYTSFFPQLVAGPIERATHLLPQLERPLPLTAARVEHGFALVVLGLFKKVVIADNAANLIDGNFDAPAGSLYALGSIYLFAIQIYGDFAGYSDIARGSAKLFGVDLMRNFEQPYLSTSITDFWRRWHISLSSWLRDYLYIPLGGNRKGPVRTYVNLIITMLLGGLWHGAAWTFIIWGGLHGLYLAAHKLMLRGKQADPGQGLARIWLKRIATFHLVCFAWIFFRGTDMEHIGTLFKTLAGMTKAGWHLFAAACLILVFVTALDLIHEKTGRHAFMLDWPLVVRIAIYTALMLAVSLFFFREPVPFIYFQF